MKTHEYGCDHGERDEKCSHCGDCADCHIAAHCRFFGGRPLAAERSDASAEGAPPRPPTA